MNPLKFLRRGEPGCIHCLFCIFGSGSKRCTHVSSWVTTRSIKLWARQEIPRNIDPNPFLSSVNIRGTHLADTFDIPKMSVRIVSTALKTYDHFASYASQVLPPITHNQGVHNLDFCTTVGIFRAARPSIILNGLSLSPC